MNLTGYSMDLDRLKEILKGSERAYLFGSFAGGDDDKYSDLDILVIMETEKDFFHRHEEFPELYKLDVAVDLLVYTSEEIAEMMENGNSFIENILHNGLRII